MPGNTPDFDELVALYKQDPEGFEALRTKLCNQLIESAPESQQRRLKGLQFQIDMERRKAANPMAACMRLSEMMHESFNELRMRLNEATGTHSSVPYKPHAKRIGLDDSKTAARVLNFPSS